MPDYDAFDALADIGAGVVQPDHTDDLRPNKRMPSTSPTKNHVEGDTTTTEQEQ